MMDEEEEKGDVVEYTVGYTRPMPKNSNYDESYSWYGVFDKKEIDDFVSKIVYYDVSQDLTGKAVYVQDKKISQSKLREKGFKIVRNKSKADFILINKAPFECGFRDPISDNWTYKRLIGKEDIEKKDLKDTYYMHIRRNGEEDSKARNDQNYNDMLEHAENVSLGCKCVLIKDIYPYLYKYIGDKELFENLSSLLESNDKNNTQMAMEMMANANWGGNEIYLQELFARQWHNNMRYNDYRTSISFHGFLASLDFDYSSVSLDLPDCYRELCKTDEHHKWVYDKYFKDFKTGLDALIQNYKIKIDELEFSIDKEIDPEPVDESDSNGY